MCNHKFVKIVSTRAFGGAVSKEQNLSAHGNIRHEERCKHCGMFRFRNVNGRHEEIGPWMSETEASSWHHTSAY